MNYKERVSIHNQVDKKINRIAEWIVHEVDDSIGEVKYLLNLIYKMKDNAIYWNEKKLTGTTKEYDSIYKWLREENRA